MNIQAVLQNFHPELFAKFILLILIGLYLVFIVMLQYQLRALRRIVLFPSKGGTIEIQVFATIYLIAIIILFLTTLFLA